MHVAWDAVIRMEAVIEEDASLRPPAEGHEYRHWAVLTASRLCCTVVGVEAQDSTPAFRAFPLLGSPCLFWLTGDPDPLSPVLGDLLLEGAAKHHSAWLAQAARL